MESMALPEVLVRDLQSAGYYPRLTQGILADSLFGEPVLSHFVHIDTHVDIESIHRHVTAFVLTETRPRSPTSTTTRQRLPAAGPGR